MKKQVKKVTAKKTAKSNKAVKTVKVTSKSGKVYYKTIKPAEKTKSTGKTEKKVSASGKVYYKQVKKGTNSAPRKSSRTYNSKDTINQVDQLLKQLRKERDEAVKRADVAEEKNKQFAILLGDAQKLLK